MAFLLGYSVMYWACAALLVGASLIGGTAGVLLVVLAVYVAVLFRVWARRG